MFRQGDVLLVPVDEIPEGVKQVRRDRGRVVLAYGEVTGHAHALEEPDAELLVLEERRFLRVPSGAELRHEEHSTIEVVPGLYEVVIQREYDDEEEWRQVLD
jgi:hypothetical protein